MRRLAIALILGLILTAPAAAQAPYPPPTGRPMTPDDVLCGPVWFVPFAPTHVDGGTYSEQVRAFMRTTKGDTVGAAFPYPWIYPNGSRADPWSAENLKRPDLPVLLQKPPQDADVSKYPPMIRYILEMSDAVGYTRVPDCTVRPSSRPTRSNAASARSNSSRVSALEIWTRTRAVPSGTTGYPKPVTNTPSRRSLSLMAIAKAVSPTMIGTIAL